MTRSRPRRRSALRITLWVIGGLVVAFLVIQLIPYGRDHTNPPVTNPFSWASPRAEAIAQESCYDCHSNETKWWWATKIAPASWLAQRDIDAGREHLNFSAWDGEVGVDEMREAVNGEMPPIQYTLIHPGAKLTDAEKQTLLQGYQASLAGNQPQGGGSSGDESGGDDSGGDSGDTTSTPGPPAADALAIIAARCSSCHEAARAEQYRAASAADAQGLIDAMVQKGATPTAAERQTLLEYFTR